MKFGGVTCDHYKFVPKEAGFTLKLRATDIKGNSDKIYNNCRMSNHKTASGYLFETSELNRTDQKPSIVFEPIFTNYFSYLQLRLCKSLNELIFKLRFIKKIQ